MYQPPGCGFSGMWFLVGSCEVVITVGCHNKLRVFLGI